MKDKVLQKILDAEKRRLNETINLVPSENAPSADVLEAVSSVFIGEYAEGKVGKRYYEGRENIDAAERLVQDRAKKLFGAEHVNAQAYSGSIANLAIYNALLKPGEKIMGLHLAHGGHLSHGWRVTQSGTLYQSVPYELDRKTEKLDYNAIAAFARKEKPKIIVAGFTAYPRTVDFKKFAEIAHNVGAYLLADISHIVGLVIAGLHPDPVPYADAVMTTTHKMLRGPRGALILCKKEYADAIDRAVFPGLQGGPHENNIAGIGVALYEAASPAYGKYVRQLAKNAAVLAAELTKHGFRLVSGGTENHLMLIDLTNKNISGAEAARTLLACGINVNRNTIPFDPRSPFDPSGIRLGTPAVTTRGMKEREMKKIATWIATALSTPENQSVLKKIRHDVQKVAKKFPYATRKR